MPDPWVLSGEYNELCGATLTGKMKKKNSFYVRSKTHLIQEEELWACCFADEVPLVVWGFQELLVILQDHCLAAPTIIIKAKVHQGCALRKLNGAQCYEPTNSYKFM